VDGGRLVEERGRLDFDVLAVDESQKEKNVSGPQGWWGTGGTMGEGVDGRRRNQGGAASIY
jgi:hypothetical protein